MILDQSSAAVGLDQTAVCARMQAGRVMIVGPLQDALFGVVLVVNTGFGVVQELRAKRELDRVAILTAARARVIRDGVAAGIPVDQVVLDDVLELRQADQVPVGGVVLRSDGLEADEALLTGEAEPVAIMGGALVTLFAVPLAGRVLALQLPPVSVCVQVAGVVLAAIGGLTLWRRIGRRPGGWRRASSRSGRSASHELGGDAAGSVRGDGEADADAA